MNIDLFVEFDTLVWLLPVKVRLEVLAVDRLVGRTVVHLHRILWNFFFT